MNEDFGSLLRNGTFSGIFRPVYTYDMDEAVGRIQIRLKRIALLDFTYPYEVSHLKVVIATADFLRTWETVLRQLNFATIVLVFTFFVIFSLVATLLMIFPNKKRDILRIFLFV